MAENDNTAAWFLLLGIGTYVGYELWKQKQCAPAAATPGSAAAPTPAIANGGATALSNVNYPSSGTTAPSLTNPGGIPVVQNPDNGMSLPAGVTQTQYSTLQTWCLSYGTPPALALSQTTDPAEYAGMYDLIVNVWANNLTPTPAQVAFWNTIANKYDPTHKYW